MPIGDRRERAADQVIAVLPLLHRAILHPVGAESGRPAMEYRVLRVLKQYGELRMTEISRCLFISKPYLTAIVDAMIAAGYVERHHDPADRRAVRIAVTADGERHLKEGIAFLRKSLLERMAILDEAEVAILSESMENLARVLSRVVMDRGRTS